MSARWPSDAPGREALVAFAASLADAARAIALAHYRRPVDVRYKADRTPVTAVDRAIEERLRACIAARFPDHGALGEELGGRARAGALNWIIDPIDGTKAFVTGKPLFGTLIGLLAGHRPLLGVLEVPALGERWIGAAGGPTTINGTPCRTSAVARLAEATLHATTIDMFQGADRRGFDALSARVRFRAFGGDCYNYGLLASGFVDLVAEADLKAHDVLALVPVVEGAGGRMTDWDGSALTLERPCARALAAAGPALHAEALALLARAAA